MWPCTFSKQQETIVYKRSNALFTAQIPDCSSDVIHKNTACLFIERFIVLLKHLHHLEWPSHENRVEQKHPSLTKLKLNTQLIKLCKKNRKKCCLSKLYQPMRHLPSLKKKKKTIIKIGVLPTSESLVACCHGKWTLLHGQLVELAELWGDIRRGRL